MIGEFTALYLNSVEYKNAIELNKRFMPSYVPFLSIKIITHHNESNFEGIICQERVFSRERCITDWNAGSSGIMQDYYNGNPGAFTFDGIRFFKIIQTATTFRNDESGLIIFSFRYITAPTFSQKNTAFMVMPFGYEPLNSFYRRNIKEHLESSKLAIKVSRSDDFTGTDVVADTILEQIKKSEFIICDITNCNKNVFFEIGYAKGIGKDMIFLLERNRPSDFFDINHIRRIEYSYDREEEFQNLLIDTLFSVRNSRLE